MCKTHGWLIPTLPFWVETLQKSFHKFLIHIFSGFYGPMCAYSLYTIAPFIKITDGFIMISFEYLSFIFSVHFRYLRIWLQVNFFIYLNKQYIKLLSCELRNVEKRKEYLNFISNYKIPYKILRALVYVIYILYHLHYLF